MWNANLRTTKIIDWSQLAIMNDFLKITNSSIHVTVFTLLYRDVKVLFACFIKTKRFPLEMSIFFCHTYHWNTHLRWPIVKAKFYTKYDYLVLLYQSRPFWSHATNNIIRKSFNTKPNNSSFTNFKSILSKSFALKDKSKTYEQHFHNRTPAHKI